MLKGFSPATYRFITLFLLNEIKMQKSTVKLIGDFTVKYSKIKMENKKVDYCLKSTKIY